MKFKDRNSQLKAALQRQPVNMENLKASLKVPNPDTVNIEGHAAYSIEDTLKLVMMLNTIKLEAQYYRSESEQMKELQELIEKVALAEGPYFVCQAIVWSRCCGEGMRSINALAAALVAPFICGEPYAKRFYSLWNKKQQKGGCIFRPDDMAEIKDVYSAINNVTLSNAMKKGFASAIERLDAYSLFKYKKVLRDIANLSHPSAKNSIAEITLENGEKMKAITAMMTGIEAKADTWETAQSEAGQIVAQAVREGKLSEKEAEEKLAKAKSDNWKSLLLDGKLGILAALRNIRNMLEVADPVVISELCNLISDADLIKKGKIMPYQVDLAYEAVKEHPNQHEVRQVIKALEDGMEKSVSNLKDAMPGRNLVVVDVSGSMGTPIRLGDRLSRVTTCAEKASLIAAMIAKGTNADIVTFSDYARFSPYNPNDSIFTIASKFKFAYGGTNLESVFRLITNEKRFYDRIIILSDSAINQGQTERMYKAYIRSVNNAYIYTIDLAVYGTAPLKGDHVMTFSGYGYAMIDAIASTEFNPREAIEKIRKIEI